MVQRLLLDRIEAKPRRPAIGCENDLVVLARPDKTKAPLALMQLAFARAEVALHAAISEPVPVAARDGSTHINVFHIVEMGRF